MQLRAAAAALLLVLLTVDVGESGIYRRHYRRKYYRSRAYRTRFLRALKKMYRIGVSLKATGGKLLRLYKVYKRYLRISNVHRLYDGEGDNELADDNNDEDMTEDDAMDIFQMLADFQDEDDGDNESKEIEVQTKE